VDYSQRRAVLDQQLTNAVRGLDSLQSSGTSTGKAILAVLLRQAQQLGEAINGLPVSGGDLTALSVIEHQHRDLESRVVAQCIESDPLRHQ
jgi:hypothetical protein